MHTSCKTNSLKNLTLCCRGQAEELSSNRHNAACVKVSDGLGANSEPSLSLLTETKASKHQIDEQTGVDQRVRRACLTACSIAILSGSIIHLSQQAPVVSLLNGLLPLDPVLLLQSCPFQHFAELGSEVVCNHSLSLFNRSLLTASIQHKLSAEDGL